MAHNFFLNRPQGTNLAAMKWIDYRASNFFKLIPRKPISLSVRICRFYEKIWLEQAYYRLELKGSRNKSKARAYLRSIVKSLTEFQAWPNKLWIGWSWAQITNTFLYFEKLGRDWAQNRKLTLSWG